MVGEQVDAVGRARALRRASTVELGEVAGAHRGRASGPELGPRMSSSVSSAAVRSRASSPARPATSSSS